MFGSNHQYAKNSSFPHASREDSYRAILKKINEKKILNMQEIRVYESMSRAERLSKNQLTGQMLPFTVLVYQAGRSYIELVLATSTVDAMRDVQLDPRFEDACSVKACYPGHFQHQFRFETDESGIV